MNNMEPEIILDARDLHKSYEMGQRSLEVLRGVSVKIERGGFVALRGASGAGKSTLLHLLGGLDVPNKGEIWTDGKNLAAVSNRALAQWRNTKVGFIFQAYHLLPELDALENVCLPARMGRVTAAKAEARGRELLAKVGLKDRVEHRPTELSGGEQQRVAIARALINSPEIILADEPTGNLDSHTGEEIMNLLCDLRTEANTTLVIATHDLEVAKRAPRVIHLTDGLIQD
ncbi:ABC transporter ATP-binding protein [Pedosphaera parvula]|uniref:ABC transporter related-protein n=1 Tax=Pedosphaera parvula (strain Ellin514) TaxID=320771 RepID=B9XF29_PEDPL|nr:ABC transporter ATP-binding protein [Pedosphaera parvula]EEF61527.1 ABC transporter related-protein [Pedosphaera parvula Ellin514]